MEQPLTVPGPLAPHPILRPYYQEQVQRQSFVQGLFDRTAPHYNLLNQLLSFGSGAWYRRRALTRAGLRPGMRVLDVATGTGLVAYQAAQVTGDPAAIIGLDISIGMLAEAQRTAPIRLLQGSVEQLPLADNSIDFLTMGYALRHVSDLVATFQEFYRVLRTPSTLMILEISLPPDGLRQRLLRFYLRQLLPRLAVWCTRQQELHTLLRYYWDTIEQCVPPDTILHAMRCAGFPDPSCEVEGGLFRVYLGRKYGEDPHG